MADPPIILGPNGRPLSRAYKAPVSGGAGTGRGGLFNQQSGLGGGSDKGKNTFFTPTRIYWRTPLEVLSSVQSWAAGEGDQRAGRRYVLAVARALG